MATSSQTVLAEQIAYYRARANEYDEWFMRVGRYDQGTEENRRWFTEVAGLQQALAAFMHHDGPTEDTPTASAQTGPRILELACGTGWWTEQLTPYAESLVAVDSSPEVIELNRQRVRSDKVSYVNANIFDCTPSFLAQATQSDATQFDVIFFSFWLSHVPPERFDDFWNLVQQTLHPQGRVFFIDSHTNGGAPIHSRRVDPQDEVIMQRNLKDGRTFQIVKIYYDPARLSQQLADLGWRAEVHTTENFFLYGSAQRI